MLHRIFLALLAAICGWLFLLGPAKAQVTVLWHVDTPIQPSNTTTPRGFDANGNIYGIQHIINAGQFTYFLHKVSSDGALEWTIEDTPLDYRDFRHNEYRDIQVDIYGNIYILGRALMDTVLGQPTWPCVVKYAPGGSRLFMRVAEPYGYTGGPNTGVAEVIAWEADSLGNIFAAGIAGLPDNAGSRGYAMIMSPEAVKISESLFDGGNPNNYIDRYNVNGPRGPDMHGNYMYQYKQTEYVDTLIMRAYHFVGYNSNGGVRWYNSSPLNPDNPSYWELADYRMYSSGNIYHQGGSNRTIEKYSPIFVLQWTKNYSNDAYVLTENPYDESVLILEIGVNDPVACYNADGSLRWRAPIPTISFWQTTIGPNHDIYTFSGSTNPVNLMRLDYHTGEIVWQDSVDLGPNPGSWGHRLLVDTAEVITWAGYDRVVKFSRHKYLTMRNAIGDSIPNTEFEMYKVHYSQPSITLDTLGRFITDDRGRLELDLVGQDTFEVELDLGVVTLVVGDTLKIGKLVHSRPAVKHQSVLGTMYSISLDNMAIDGDGWLSYTVLNDTAFQDIKLNHTEYRYNLLVSVEWNAEAAYLEGVENNFKAAANYLYDVSDGQIRLDTVMIFDNDDFQAEADVRILATNLHRPDAYINGILNSGYCGNNFCGYPITLPRKWYGSKNVNRDSTYDYHPLNDLVSWHYRTIIHEFGHYSLGFDDEYEFRDIAGNDLGPGGRCEPRPGGNYGFMDFHYEGFTGGVRSSEMSSQYRYANAACQNTLQYRTNGRSCWNYWESWAEGERGPEDILVPILRPDLTDTLEHVPTTGYDYITGPNDILDAPDYDVGSLIVFPIGVSAPPSNIRSLHLMITDAVPAGGVEITLRKPDQSGGFYSIVQGKTTDLGLIYVLGADRLQDHIEASIYNWQFTAPPRGLATIVTDYQKGWLSGTLDLSGGEGDSVMMQLTAISGNYPLIVSLACATDSNAAIALQTSAFMPVLPTVEVLSFYGDYSNDTMSVGADGYYLNLNGFLGSEGVLRFRSEDDQQQPFFFDGAYVIQPGESMAHVVSGPGGLSVDLDTSNVGVELVVLVSSMFPCPTDGLPADALQAGQTQTITVSPQQELNGHNYISINYADADLVIDENHRGDESTLRMYTWDSGPGEWVLLGGVVDTLENTVSASMPGAGSYASFTSSIISDIDDGHGEILPYRFELSQNYPNPFNPLTSIEFNLPARSHVTIDIYNVLGQKVRTLIDQEESAGSYTVLWDGTDDSGGSIATGTYLYRFRAGDYIETKKMLLLK